MLPPDEVAQLAELPEVPGVRHRFVDANGVRFHYAEAGSGDPLLLLHGWPQHWYQWRHQIDALARSYRVICPDFPGFGWSEAPAGKYEKEQLTTELVAFLDAIGVRRCRLLAHDWGAWIGYLLCMRYPERIERYVALSIPPPFTKFGWQVLTLVRSWYMLVIALPWVGAHLIRGQHFVKWLLRAGCRSRRWSSEELDIYASPLRQRSRARASVMLYRTFLLREIVPVIAGRYRRGPFLVPTLVLAGDSDLFVSSKLLRAGHPLARALRVELVVGCGHFIAEERPQLVIRRAREFFAAAAQPGETATPAGGIS